MGMKPDGLSDRGMMRGTNPFFAPGETMFSPVTYRKNKINYYNYKIL